MTVHSSTVIFLPQFCLPQFCWLESNTSQAPVTQAPKTLEGDQSIKIPEQPLYQTVFFVTVFHALAILWMNIKVKLRKKA